MIIETQEQFQQFIGEDVPSALFHVMRTDVDDDETGARLDEIILLQMLAGTPTALKFKSLSWFVEYFIESQKM